MRFEDEIRTTKFQSEIQKAQLNILFSAAWVRSRIGRRLKPFGVTAEQFNVLRILRGHAPEGIRVLDITRRMLERNSNTTRLIDRLESKGLVQRLTAGHDRRERAIVLTPAGRELLARIDADWANNSPHSSPLSDDEARQLNALLDRLRDC